MVDKNDRFEIERADRLRSEAYQKALGSEDPLFHSCLYEWFIGKEMTDQLLEIRSPFLEGHLMREPVTLEVSCDACS